MSQLFDELAFLEKVRKRIDDVGGPAVAARQSGIDHSMMSRIRDGKKGAKYTETFFRLYRWMTGKLPVQ